MEESGLSQASDPSGTLRAGGVDVLGTEREQLAGPGAGEDLEVYQRRHLWAHVRLDRLNDVDGDRLDGRVVGGGVAAALEWREG